MGNIIAIILVGTCMILVMSGAYMLSVILRHVCLNYTSEISWHSKQYRYTKDRYARTTTGTFCGMFSPGSIRCPIRISRICIEGKYGEFICRDGNGPIYLDKNVILNEPYIRQYYPSICNSACSVRLDDIEINEKSSWMVNYRLRSGLLVFHDRNIEISELWSFLCNLRDPHSRIFLVPFDEKIRTKSYCPYLFGDPDYWMMDTSWIHHIIRHNIMQRLNYPFAE